MGGTESNVPDGNVRLIVQKLCRLLSQEQAA